MTDLAAARERHRPWEGYCNECGQPWPCDAARFRDALDAELVEYATLERLLNVERANHDMTYQGAQRCADERNAARALADELAEALRKAAYTLWEDWDDVERMLSRTEYVAALAKWEASK